MPLKAASDYQGYLHGEAISIGMFVASFISEQMGLMSTVDRIRLGTLLTRAGLPSRVRQPIPREKTDDPSGPGRGLIKNQRKGRFVSYCSKGF